MFTMTPCTTHNTCSVMDDSLDSEDEAEENEQRFSAKRGKT